MDLRLIGQAKLRENGVGALLHCRPTGESAWRGRRASSSSTIDDRASRRYLFEGPQQLVEIADPVFKPVSQSVRAVLQKLKRIRFLGVLREHHHTSVRVSGADGVDVDDSACFTGASP